MVHTLEELFARSHGAVASFNCIDLEMARGCIEAAEAADHPVIIGVATRHWNAVGGRSFIPSLRAVCEAAAVPVALHLDHAKATQLDIVEEALAEGFTSIMIDGSTLPYEENVRVTQEVVSTAHGRGASVEAELGPLIGEEGVAAVVDASTVSKYTDPDEAHRFCQETGVDALAVAVGTAHGLYKDEPRLQMELISELNEKAAAPLVLHGATGVSDEAIREAVRRGVRKINYFSGLLVEAMETIVSATDPADTDYLAFRLRLREGWKRRAAALIALYRG